LAGYRAALKSSEFCGAHCHILLNLHDVDLVLATFRLDRQYMMGAFSVNAYVDPIDFDLPDFLHLRPQMILQRIAR